MKAVHLSHLLHHYKTSTPHATLHQSNLWYMRQQCLLSAGDQPTQALQEETRSSVAGSTSPELRMLRKRQSFSFSDDRLRPALLVDQSQTDTVQSTMQPAATPAAASAASFQSLADDTSESGKLVKKPGQKLSMPSTAVGRSKQAVSQTGVSQAAQESRQPHTAIKRSPIAAKTGPARTGSSSKPDADRGRAPARADSAEVPAETSKPGSGIRKPITGISKPGSAASKGSKHFGLHKADWQH